MKPCRTIETYATLRYLGIAICVVGLNAAWAPRATAAPVSFGSNFYEIIQAPNPFPGNNNAWATTGSATADASVFNSISGHLATITSQAENDFLSQQEAIAPETDLPTEPVPARVCNGGTCQSPFGGIPGQRACPSSGGPTCTGELECACVCVLKSVQDRDQVVGVNRCLR
jgi:hypothetical protein